MCPLLAANVFLAGVVLEFAPLTHSRDSTSLILVQENRKEPRS